MICHVRADDDLQSTRRGTNGNRHLKLGETAEFGRRRVGVDGAQQKARLVIGCLEAGEENNGVPALGTAVVVARLDIECPHGQSPSRAGRQC